MSIPDDSFQFSTGNGTWNSLTDWGIRVLAHDMAAPEKRNNTRLIPKVSGMYRAPGKYYNERRLTVVCDLVQKVTRFQVRKIMGILSNEGHIQFCDEADDVFDENGGYISRALYYRGAMFAAPPLETFFDECMRRFTLEFLCYPYALGEVAPIPIASGVNPIKYQGTAETPCIIVLDNIGNTPVSNITITTIKKEI